MEILKSMATLFRLFYVTRANPDPTVLREGFFNKAVECTTVIEHR
jgi:benzoate 4-monooxygenase